MFLMCIYIYIHTYIYTNLYTHIISLSLYIYIYTHIMYIYIYIYIHTQIHNMCRFEHFNKDMHRLHIWVLEGVVQCMLSTDAVLESLGLVTIWFCEICATTFEVMFFLFWKVCIQFDQLLILVTQICDLLWMIFLCPGCLPRGFRGAFHPRWAILSPRCRRTRRCCATQPSASPRRSWRHMSRQMSTTYHTQM